jgi:hypothetical protein
MFTKPFLRFGSAALLVVALLFSIVILRSSAQQPMGRITRAINNSARITLAGSRPPRIQTADDLGRMESSKQLHGISLVFSRTAAQEAALEKLIADQQNPKSALYHKWLTPDQFGARFGLSQTDLAKVQGWLGQQGFSIDSISRSRNSIRFSGTVGRVETAFGTEMHNYRVGAENHYAPAREISLPAALSPVVLSVRNLSSFRPRPHIRKPFAKFTSSQSGNHFLTPKDVATIYDINNPDINSAVSSGPNGAGQSIAIVGQSSVALSDIENFEKALGRPTIKDPTLVLVPGSGDVEEFSGDEAESDLDLEYSSGIATGATVYFVYTGNDANFSVWDSINYAVQTQIAPIISSSYGICETALTASDYSTLNGIMAQAAAQGQTVIAAAGDSGSADCSGVSGLTTAQQQALAVDFPASSQYVTGMGGSEFPTEDVCAASSSCTKSAPFWTAANGSDVLSSALSYIPEGVWNDDSSTALSSGGGGISTLTPRQNWQGGSAFPSGSFRLVPDISLTASPNNAAFLFCSSDTGFTGVTGSCSNGFRDTNNQSLTGGGGTSFDAPIFAGLVALINQKENSIGQGSVNSTLYSLASNSTTYGSAFHDIINGNNKCTAGSSLCSTQAAGQYSAGTGYDEASGLGSIDFSNLLGAWPASSSSSKAASTTTLSPASFSPAVGSTDVITITVSPVSSTNPGTLTVLVDGTAVTPPTLTSGVATYNFAPGSTGSHTITATYSGDPTYAPSTGTVVVDNQAFRVMATNVSVTAGKSGNSTVTITPQEGYTGTIAWTVSSSSNLADACYSISNSTVSGTSPVTATLSIQTSGSACSSGSLTPPAGIGHQSKIEMASANSTSSSRGIAHSLVLGLGLLFAGVFIPRFDRRYKVTTIAATLILAGIALIAVGCGGSPSSVVPTPSSANASPGTYTLTVIGTDSSNSAIAGAATLTLTIN